MVELTYKESGLLEPNLVFTTDVVITPDKLPFANINPHPRKLSRLYIQPHSIGPLTSGLSYWVAQYATNSANAIQQLAAGLPAILLLLKSMAH